jgi:hypothetical protein
MKADAQVSRECRRQRRLQADGICVIAGCGKKAVNRRNCEEHRAEKAAYVKTRKRLKAGIPLNWPDQRGRWPRPRYGEGQAV